MRGEGTPRSDLFATCSSDPKLVIKVYEVFIVLFGLAMVAYVLSLGMSPN